VNVLCALQHTLLGRCDQGDRNVGSAVEVRNAYQIFVCRPEGGCHLDTSVLDGGIILEWTLMNYNDNVI
jgi:hypothetical protein